MSGIEGSDRGQTVTCQFGHETTVGGLKKEGQDYYCPDCYADVTGRVLNLRYMDTESGDQ